MPMRMQIPIRTCRRKSQWQCSLSIVPARRIFRTRETIRAILAKIGKNGPEDELNCGSCGYPTCRAKAIAVYQGKAELHMCIPYMKERAESLSNCVLTETPNITIIVDSDLNIIEFNAAAERAFRIPATRHCRSASMS